VEHSTAFDWGEMLGKTLRERAGITPAQRKTEVRVGNFLLLLEQRFKGALRVLVTKGGMRGCVEGGKLRDAVLTSTKMGEEMGSEDR